MTRNLIIPTQVKVKKFTYDMSFHKQQYQPLYKQIRNQIKINYKTLLKYEPNSVKDNVTISLKVAGGCLVRCKQ